MWLSRPTEACRASDVSVISLPELAHRIQSVYVHPHKIPSSQTVNVFATFGMLQLYNLVNIYKTVALVTRSTQLPYLKSHVFPYVTPSRLVNIY